MNKRMKKPEAPRQKAKTQSVLQRRGFLCKRADGLHATPQAGKHSRALSIEDFGLSAFYFSEINARSLLNTATRSHHQSWPRPGKQFYKEAV